MPELLELVVIRDLLRQWVARHKATVQIADPINGRWWPVTEIHCHGKHLLVELGGGQRTLDIHFMLDGVLRVVHEDTTTNAGDRSDRAIMGSAAVLVGDDDRWTWQLRDAKRRLATWSLVETLHAQLAPSFWLPEHTHSDYVNEFQRLLSKAGNKNIESVLGAQDLVWSGLGKWLIDTWLKAGGVTGKEKAKSLTVDQVMHANAVVRDMLRDEHALLTSTLGADDIERVYAVSHARRSVVQSVALKQVDAQVLVNALLDQVSDEWLLPCTGNVFHAAVRAITSQQIRFEAGQGVRRRLYLWSSGQEWTPDFLTRLTVEQWTELGALGLTDAHHTTLLELARTAGGEGSLLSASFFDKNRVRGVGPWTHQNILVSTGARDDLLIEGDKYIEHHLRQWGLSADQIKAAAPPSSWSRLTRILWRLLKTSSRKLTTVGGIRSLTQVDFHPVPPAPPQPTINTTTGEDQKMCGGT
jgi:formamidopyrimidine-DNA glycosylase